VRLLFPPVTQQLLGANAPAHWLKQAGGSRGSPPGIIRVLKGISAVVALAIVGTWMTKRSMPPKAGVLMLFAVLLVAYRILKRG